MFEEGQVPLPSDDRRDLGVDDPVATDALPAATAPIPPRP
jgi:hypothetical protein